MTVYLDPKGGVVLASPDEPLVGQVGSFLQVQGTLVEAAAAERTPARTAAARCSMPSPSARPGQDAFADLSTPARRPRHRAGGKSATHRFVDRSLRSRRDCRARASAGRTGCSTTWSAGCVCFCSGLISSAARSAAAAAAPPSRGRPAAAKRSPSAASSNAFDRILVERTGRRDLGSQVIREGVRVALRVSRPLRQERPRSSSTTCVRWRRVRSARRRRSPAAARRALARRGRGLARAAGPDSAVYDRVLTTLLQRLDDPTDDLGRLPLVLISTSNRPDLLDSAMARRLGVHARLPGSIAKG